AQFFSSDAWVAAPGDWSPRTQTGARYDLSSGEGARRAQGADRTGLGQPRWGGSSVENLTLQVLRIRGGNLVGDARFERATFGPGALRAGDPRRHPRDLGGRAHARGGRPPRRPRRLLPG